jgi:uroporphyrinogen decarboxylase
MRISFVGFYGQLRNWMGMENLSYAFYDYPEMVHEMVGHWAELCARQIERLPADIVIDQVDWWEDMASKNGPLVSPSVFRCFLRPGYHRVMSAARARGCVLGMVDCDGDPYRIVGNWLEEGVNIMFPVEIGAGSDPYRWRQEHGLALRLRGGIAKRPLVEGGKAIDRELERIRPLLEQGGYVPHLDHLVPPDVPYGHYCQYLEKKRKLIGRQCPRRT